MFTEAALWTPGEDGRALCALCAHRCSVAPGHWGICGVRENRAGTLVTHAYGRVVAAAVDPIEKKPLYHFLPGTTSFSVATAGCNFRCGFCQNWSISQLRAENGEAEGRPLPPERIAALARENGCASVSYTYTEPTIFFEYARDAALPARAAGLANVFVSNGYMTAEAAAASRPWLDAANIDLKAFRDETYRKVCGARLQPVLETIERLRAAGVWIEVTTLIVPGMNDGEDELADIARFLASLDRDIPWHISRFHPDYEITDRPVTPVRDFGPGRRHRPGRGTPLHLRRQRPRRGRRDRLPRLRHGARPALGLRRPGEPPRRRRPLPQLPHACGRPLVLPRGQAALR